MAVYIRAKKIINPSKYNQSADDLLEDFVLDELNLAKKVIHELELVPPVISGTKNWELLVDAETPDWLEDVTAYDEQQGDLTDDIVVDDSDVDLSEAGTYELVYTVEDASGTEAEVVVEVEVDYEKFAVTYNLDGGINNEDNPDWFYESDLPITLEPATKEGYLFIAWHDVETLDNAVSTIEVAEATELWAEFEEAFTITYNLDGGVNNVNNPELFSDNDLDVTLAAPTKAGYTFVAWHDAETLDSPITDITVAEDTEVWAEWEIIEYTVTYNLDGGENHLDNPATFDIEDLPITLEPATKAGNDFVAWHDAVTLDSPITEIDSIGNIELWAEFTPSI